MLDQTRAKRLAESVDRLKKLSVFETTDIDQLSHYKTHQFLEPTEVQTADFEPCDVGFSWDRDRQSEPESRLDADVDVTDGSTLPKSLAVGQNVWFRLQFTIPDSMAGRPVYLNFVVDPIGADDGDMGEPHVECLCYRNGEPWQAFDDGHEDLLLTDDASGGETFDLLIEAGTTTLWGLLDVDRFKLTTAQVYATRDAVEELWYNYSVLDELRQELAQDSPNWGKITGALVDASHTFAFDADSEAEYERTAEDALAILDDLKENLTSELTNYDLTAIGHAHIDLAWLWPWSETVRKGGRSFSNVLKLMEEYPEFMFLQSQPHLYEFLRNRYPDLYERITDRISDGAWQPTGALWVESDINLAGGEALARQYLLGKRYFRDEYGVDPQITFIPDVFGYSGALPEIANAADCPYFLTQKMSWSEINDFPHTSFNWEGIGGSSILSHFPPGDTYNGDMSVEQIQRSVTNNDENDIVDEGAYLFGWGDGGGGPTREMIERKEVIDDVGSLPDISFGSLQDFFDRLSESREELPDWTGELYLEKHRGTLTTQAQTKQNNRTGEFALREAEIWSSLALTADGEFEYADDRLEHAWKTLLFNQFHDILPGSSVTDVYADADRDYEQVFEDTEDVTQQALDTLFNPSDSGATICVTNSLPWQRSPVVEVDTDQVPVDDEAVAAVAADGDDETLFPVQPSGTESDSLVFQPQSLPAFGAKSFEFVPAPDQQDSSPLKATPSSLENNRIHVALNDEGTISAYDKVADRQLFDGTGNRLVSYRDQPNQWDAWDIDGDIYDVGEDLPAPTDVSVIEDGPVRATVRQTREYGNSTITQDITIHRDSAQIDFKTSVDWDEEERLLKAHFPMAVHTSKATYDIQFGHIERDTTENTSWEAAQFEEPHHQWVDVSEYDYGTAVLNDSKYGVHVDGTNVSLSLLRAPNSPDPEADRGHHEFQYSVYPHEGDLREGGVVEAGYNLNTPVHTMPVETPVSYEPLELDTDGVVVESIKQSEDHDDALVIRLYEAYGRTTAAELAFDFPVASAAETNLIEDHEQDLEIGKDNSLALQLEPFDIRTLLVKLD